MKFLALKKILPYYLLLVLLSPLLFIPKGNILRYINTFHNWYLNKLFINVTNLGDGVWIAVGLLILIFCFKLKYTYQFALSALLQIIVVLLMKEVFFTHLFRPYHYFGEAMRPFIDFVPGVKIRYTDTFPSGHTATATFITSYIALVGKRKWQPYLLVLVAAGVGLSRVYLVQHFFIDAYFGMVFGLLSSLTANYLVKQYPRSWYNKRVVVSWPQHIQEPVKRFLTTIHLF